MQTIHKAVAFVQETEALWETNKEAAHSRAMLIVCHLIHAGFIKGAVDEGHGIGIPWEPKERVEHGGIPS